MLAYRPQNSREQSSTLDWDTGENSVTTGEKSGSKFKPEKNTVQPEKNPGFPEKNSVSIRCQGWGVEEAWGEREKEQEGGRGEKGQGHWQGETQGRS